ncbi:MAG: Na+/H+ antiporter NhaA [Pyrinomonadaceae bacterium]
MSVVQRKLSNSFQAFFASEKAGGIILIVCTVVSLILANSMIGPSYLAFWHSDLGGLSIDLWVNDALMAVFFLLIGLELEREFYNGELSDIRNALLPIFAAVGGIAVPVLIHLSLNWGTDGQAGMGIPMATDIAFAIGALSLLGSRIPASLKVFLTALAVIDDLGAILVIAILYTAKLSAVYLACSLLVWASLVILNRYFKVVSLIPYLIGGVLMWYLMLRSGVHATIAGVLLAFAIPFSTKEDDEASPSHRLENFLHKPVAFFILPVFALANTGLVLGADSFHTLGNFNEIGIMAGLVIGKPVGITLICFAVVTLGLCRLPLDLNWKHIFGAGLLGGIGFTMSIFITNLAFAANPLETNGSKMAILLASMTAGTIGFIYLKLFGKPEAIDEDMDAMDFEEADAG